MKILIYSPKFYPSVGGLENLTLMLAIDFLKKGNDVKVITNEPSDGTICGVKTYRQPSLHQQIRLFTWCDVFYMPNFSLKGIWLLALNPFKKWVVSHNGWYSDVKGKMRLPEVLKLKLSRMATNIAVSQAVKNHIDLPAIVIHNCYDNEIFRPAFLNKPKKEILFVGRLVSDKGCNILLEAIDQLPEEMSLTATIVGTGNEKERLKGQAKKLPPNKRVVFTGQLTGAKLATVMSEHDLLIVPSLIPEGFGIVALEGLACGCRVVASDNGGLKEALGTAGHYFDTGDANMLAQLIHHLLRENPAKQQTGAGALLADKSVSVVSGKYLNVFRT